ncbi:unnamed protein product, partial [Amoebophrya sp. A25]
NENVFFRLKIQVLWYTYLCVAYDSLARTNMRSNSSLLVRTIHNSIKRFGGSLIDYMYRIKCKAEQEVFSILVTHD